MNRKSLKNKIRIALKRERKPFPVERFVFVLLFFLTTMLFAVKVSGPSNLLDNDQERPASYILDVTQNHHWVCQKDETGDITSKPPLYTWLGAFSTKFIGKNRISLLTLYFPCYLSVLGIVLLVYDVGRRNFGWKPAALASILIILSPIGMKMIALARTDPLFGFTIALTAFAAYRAWTKGLGVWGWTLFWMAATLATLTKGPLGLVLGTAGLTSWFWNRFDKVSQKNISPSALWGVILFLGIIAGWFFWAYQVEGEALYNKMIRSELVNHAVSSSYGIPGKGFVLTPLYLISRFLPWSLLGMWGCVEVFRKPAENESERLFERFLFCWIIVGCFVLGLGTHQRGDLIFPLVPPVALLGARAVYRIIPQKVTEKSMNYFRSLGILGMTGIGFMLSYTQVIFSQQDVVKETTAIRTAAENIEELILKEPDFKLSQVKFYRDVRFALQFSLNTMKPTLTTDEALQLLQSSAPQLLIIHDLEKFKQETGEVSIPYRVVYRWNYENRPFLFMISNKAWNDSASSLVSVTRNLVK